MQKAQLFGGTIRSNLLWGNQNASDADLWGVILHRVAKDLHAALDVYKRQPG